MFGSKIFFVSFLYMFFLKKMGYLSTNCDGAFTGFCERVYRVHNFCQYSTRFFVIFTHGHVHISLHVSAPKSAIFRSGHTSTSFLPSLRYSTRFLDISAQGHFHPSQPSVWTWYHMWVLFLTISTKTGQFCCGYPSFLAPTRPLGYIKEGRST